MVDRSTRKQITMHEYEQWNSITDGLNERDWQ